MQAALTRAVGRKTMAICYKVGGCGGRWVFGAQCVKDHANCQVFKHNLCLGSFTNYVNSQGEGRGQKFRKNVHVIRVNLCSHEGGGGQKHPKSCSRSL